MTDPEIVRWLAEKVMGWHVQTAEEARRKTIGHSDCRVCENGQIYAPLGWWNPLTDARATERAMEALRQRGYVWTIESTLATVRIPDNPPHSTHGKRPGIYRAVDDRGWKRALCIAAMRATGGEV